MNLQKINEWVEGGCSSWGIPEYEIRKLIEAYGASREALKEIVEVTEGTKGLPYSAAYSSAMRVLGGE